MVKLINTYVTQKRLSWHGHVMRRDDNNIAKEVTTMTVGGKRPRGRTRLRWVDRVRSDMKEQKKPRTEPINMEQGSHGDRPREGIRSAKLSSVINYVLSIYLASHNFIQMFVPI